MQQARGQEATFGKIRDPLGYWHLSKERLNEMLQGRKACAMFQKGEMLTDLRTTSPTLQHRWSGTLQTRSSRSRPLPFQTVGPESGLGGGRSSISWTLREPPVSPVNAPVDPRGDDISCYSFILNYLDTYSVVRSS